jgi:hypothetical protein
MDGPAAGFVEPFEAMEVLRTLKEAILAAEGS